MKKKILIGVIVLVVIVLGIGFYLYQGTKKSPPKTATASNAGLEVKVTYCAPYKKGRLIFGEAKDGALQPYGKYWRLGANAATEITFSKNVNFAGKPVEAGTFRMYAVPGADTWQIGLNSELGKWGYNEPDYTKDVVKVSVPSASSPAETEQFIINFSNDSTAVLMDFVWDKTLVRIPITPQ